MKINKQSIFLLKSAVLTIILLNITGTKAIEQKNCCGDDYLTFNGNHCIANDFHEYLPALKCENYVLLAELIDDEFDDGT